MAQPEAGPQDRFLLVTNNPRHSRDIDTMLRFAGTVTSVTPAELANHAGSYFRIFIDINLSDLKRAAELRMSLDRSPVKSLPRYFIVADELHHEKTQAWALGAQAVIARPLDPEMLLGQVRVDCVSAFEARVATMAKPLSQGIGAAHTVLVQMFEGLQRGKGLSFNDVLSREEPIARALEASGLKSWLDAVSQHHNHSYRHCLSVTGLTVAFAQRLGFHADDQNRMARAALLHDVGKAYIPFAILDKPGKLTDSEMEHMRRHAELGFDALNQQGGFPKETLDVALHHHEMLDGSGYPNGLKGGQISDVVRMVTIADIYSALIEQRSYHEPMERDAAYAVLQSMRGRLDPDLVREFSYIALGQ